MESFLNTFGLYLFIVNTAAIFITVYDKAAAIRHKQRIRENTLLLLSGIGGSLSMLLTMIIIRHKTRHLKFMIGIPIIIIIQTILFLLFAEYIL